MASYPWDQRRDIYTRQQVEDLRMPRPYGSPPGGELGYPSGAELGAVDPLALIAHAQGGPYDMSGRRALIAKRLLDNELAQRAAQVAQALPGEGLDQWKDSGQEPDVGIGAGDNPAATGREPSSVTQDNFFERAIPPDFDRGKPPAPVPDVPPPVNLTS